VNKQAEELKQKLLSLGASEAIIKREVADFLSRVHKDVKQSLQSNEQLDETVVLKKLQKIDLNTKNHIEKFKEQKNWSIKKNKILKKIELF
jgi:hypothetical protein